MVSRRRAARLDQSLRQWPGDRGTVESTDSGEIDWDRIEHLLTTRNDVLNQPNIAGFCGTCHDTPNSGNHSVKAPLNIGVANAGAAAPPVLDLSGLPVFTVWCTAGPLAGQVFQVTDIGRAMITGECADIGKTKGPVLRGLAARAPDFPQRLRRYAQ